MKERKLVLNETEGAELLQGGSLQGKLQDFPGSIAEIECGQPWMGSLHSFQMSGTEKASVLPRALGLIKEALPLGCRLTRALSFALGYCLLQSIPHLHPEGCLPNRAIGSSPPLWYQESLGPAWIMLWGGLRSSSACSFCCHKSRVLQCSEHRACHQVVCSWDLISHFLVVAHPWLSSPPHTL